MNLGSEGDSLLELDSSSGEVSNGADLISAISSSQESEETQLEMTGYLQVQFCSFLLECKYVQLFNSCVS